MKDSGNDEKRQDNSKVENMEKVSADGWLTESFSLLFKIATSFIINPKYEFKC